MATLSLDATDSLLCMANSAETVFDKFSGGNGQFGRFATGDTLRMAFKFSLASLPASSTITSAIFQFTNYQSFGTRDVYDVLSYGAAGTDDPSSDSAAVAYGRCASGTLYFNNDTGIASPGGGDLTSDITSAAAAQISAAAGGNFSIAMKYDDETLPGSDQLANTRGYDNGDPAVHPKLTLIYTVSAASSVAGDGMRWNWR